MEMLLMLLLFSHHSVSAATACIGVSAQSGVCATYNYVITPLRTFTTECPNNRYIYNTCCSITAVTTNCPKFKVAYTGGPNGYVNPRQWFTPDGQRHCCLPVPVDQLNLVPYSNTSIPTTLPTSLKPTQIPTSVQPTSPKPTNPTTYPSLRPTSLKPMNKPTTSPTQHPTSLKPHKTTATLTSIEISLVKSTIASTSLISTDPTSIQPTVVPTTPST